MVDQTSEQPSIDEEARRRFEAAWRAGRPEPIECFLPAFEDSTYAATVEELVHIELEVAWRAGRAPPGGERPPLVEDYVNRFPALTEPAVLLELVRQEYRVRHRFGDKPAREEYAERFPAIADNGVELGEPPPALSVAAGGSQPGDRLGRYRLRSQHARGGFGLVWRADDDLLDREVAVKQLSAPLAREADLRRRLLAEARITARLQHPGIVPVYDMGGVEGDRPFYTMKLVSGQTFSEAIRGLHDPARHAADKAVERLRLLNAFLAIARATAYAHSRGVIHRDLKPDNVLLGDFGETVILDWGLAKSLEETSQESAVKGNDHEAPSPGSGSDLTQRGTVLGTPAYMSPEQAAGRTDLLDERCDVYCLGAILYQVLTGVPPYQGADSQEVIAQVLKKAPPRPRALDHSIPRALEAICLQAMAREHSARYPGAEALAMDLERYLADEPVAAYSQGPVERLARWSRHHRSAVAAGVVAAVLLFLASAAGLYLWQRDWERRHQDLLEADRTAGEADAAGLEELRAGRFASALALTQQGLQPLEGKPELLERWQHLAGRRDRLRRLVEFHRLADDVERLAFLEYDAEVITSAESALVCLGVFENDTRWPAALPVEDLAAEQANRLRDEVFRTLLLLSGVRAKRGLVNFGAASAAESFRSATQTVRLAHAYRLSHSSRLVEQFCRFGLEPAGKFEPLPVPAPTGAADYYFLGMMQFWVSQLPNDPVSQVVLGPWGTLSGLDFKAPLASAERFLRSAADLEPDHYWTHLWRGWAFIAAKNPHAAELCFDTCIVLRPAYGLGYANRAVAIMRQAAAATTDRADLERRAVDDYSRARERDPYEPWIHWLQAMGQLTAGRDVEALVACGRALALERPVSYWVGQRIHADKVHVCRDALKVADRVAHADPKNAQAWAVRALAGFTLGRDDEALADANRVLQLDPKEARALAVRGAVRLRRKETGLALEDFRRARAGEPALYAAAAGLAQALAALKEWDTALPAYQEAALVAVTPWQRAEAQAGRAEALYRLGRQPEAREALDEVRASDPGMAESLSRRLFPKVP